MTGIDMSDANLTGISAKQLIGTPKALPRRWKFLKSTLIGPGADVSGLNLSGTSLSGVDLAGANLSGADLSNVAMVGVGSGRISGVPAALPAGWKLTGGYLIGPGANLTGAVMAGMNLAQVNLSGATLTGVRSGGISGPIKTLPRFWSFAGGYLIGPRANLSGASLGGVDFGMASLDGANLTGANIGGARLGKASLTGVTGSGITGTPASLPKGWRLSGGELTKS